MTLRESANSFIRSVVLANAYHDAEDDEFSSKNWNVLHSLKAREYILEQLHNKADKFIFHFCHDEVNNIYILKIDPKPIRKTPISHLELDDEFTWDKISLC